jgi:hypothetical protein
MRYVLALAVLVVALAGCSSGGGDGGAAPSPSPGGGTAPEPAPGQDLFFPDAPMSMAGNSTTSVQLMFRVRYESSTPGAVTNIAWTVTREDGTQAAAGVVGSIEPGTSENEEVTITPAANGERFTIRLDTGNQVAESSEINNDVTVTANLGSVDAPTESFDVRFNDSHYHGMYYYNDPRFHFYLINPNREGHDATGVTYEIRDEMTDEVYYQLPAGQELTVRAPTAEELAANSFPQVQVFLATNQLTKRPAPGRRVFRITVTAPGDTDITNNVRRLVVDVPQNQAVPLTAGPVADLQFQDPHFHHWGSSVVWHFFILNRHNQAGVSQTVNWRLVREDGVEIRAGSATIPANGLFETSFRDSDRGPDEMRYTLTIQPAEGSQDATTVGNQVGFIVDWTPTGAG